MLAVILCARMRSERFPGKVLSVYCPDGTNNLQQLLRRWRFHLQPVAARLIVATSWQVDDDMIDAVCDQEQVPCFRGSMDNLVERMERAVRRFAPRATYVVRALADNPLVDVPMLLERHRLLQKSKADFLWYGGEDSKLTYCATTDLWPRHTWNRIVTNSALPEELEHPGVYLLKHKEYYTGVVMPLPPPLYCLPVRTELDTLDDLAMFQTLWTFWYDRSPTGQRPAHLLGTGMGLRLLQTYPEIAALNRHVPEKTHTFRP